jgi:tetratricopeptide (TPR) repeat protein
MMMAERMSKSQPNHARWQELLAATYERMGSLLQCAQGQQQETLRLFEESVRIQEHLVKRNAADDAAYRNLSVVYNKIGEIRQQQRETAQALDCFLKSLKIRERLSAAKPEHPDFQYDLAAAHAKLASVYNQLQQRDQELDALQRGKLIMDRLVKLAPENLQWKQQCEWFDAKTSGR